MRVKKNLQEELFKMIDINKEDLFNVFGDGDKILNCGNYDLVDNIDEDGYNYFDKYIIKNKGKWYKVKYGYINDELEINLAEDESYEALALEYLNDWGNEDDIKLWGN